MPCQEESTLPFFLDMGNDYAGATLLSVKPCRCRLIGDAWISLDTSADCWDLRLVSCEQLRPGRISCRRFYYRLCLHSVVRLTIASKRTNLVGYNTSPLCGYWAKADTRVAVLRSRHLIFLLPCNVVQGYESTKDEPVGPCFAVCSVAFVNVVCG